MAFRNPVTTAIDPTARDLASQAYTAATTGIIPGSRLAADAIDGKTITGATFRTAASGQRLELTSAAGLRGFAADGTTVKTQVGTDGKLSAVDATITGTLRTGASGQRVEVSQTDTYPGSFVGQNGVVRFLLGDESATKTPAGLDYTYFPGDGASELYLRGAKRVPAGSYQPAISIGEETTGHTHIELDADTILVGTGGAAVYLDPTTAPTLRLTSTGDASATSTAHAFQIGPDNGLNMIIDQNEILFRNNGVQTGAAATQAYVDARVPTSGRPASGTGTLTIAAGGVSATGTQSFGKTFTTAPDVVACLAASANDWLWSIFVTGVTTTGFTVRIQWTDRATTAPVTGAVNFRWIALN